MSNVVLDFFLPKDIVTLTVFYVNLQLEGIGWYRIAMQKMIKEVLEDPKFEHDHNSRNI
jgi:hypothetical protein